MIYVGVDPGKHHCGIAIFDDARLVAASLQERGVDCIDFVADEVFGATTAVGIERMVVRPGSRQVGRQKDLVDVSLAGGEFAGGLRERMLHSVYRLEFEYITPDRWKGQRSKEVHWREYVLPRLTQTERDAIEWPTQKTLRHNVKDAIGIAYYFRKVIRVRLKVQQA